MKIFVTGASGFIGKNLLPVLGSHELLCLSHSQQVNCTKQNVKTITGDLNDPETYIYALKLFKPDCCIHLAWSGIPDYSVENSSKNLLASINLVKNLVEVDCKKICIIGSCWEYGNIKGKVTENCNPVDQNIFASFKTSIRIISESICNGSNTSLVWGRAFFIYGPEQRDEALIPSCYQSLKNSEKPNINNPLARNDFVYILDVVNSIRILVESEGSSGVYNIGSGDSTPVWDVVNKVADALGLPHPYSDMPIMLDNNFADMSKMKTHDWTLQFPLASGIANTVKFLEEDL